MAETVGQLEDGQDELALGSASFLHAGFQGQVLDQRGVGSRSREEGDGACRVGRASPAVPEVMIKNRMLATFVGSEGAAQHHVRLPPPL